MTDEARFFDPRARQYPLAQLVQELRPRTPHALRPALDRRVRLYCVAECRRIEPFIRVSQVGGLLDDAEKYADGLIEPERWLEIERFLQAMNFGATGMTAEQLLFAAIESDLMIHHLPRIWQKLLASGPPWGREQDECEAESLVLIRDIFSTTFRPVEFDPRWRTSDVVDLARGIYEAKAFDKMPMLADALMDAGCEEEQIIAHCKGDGPHVRGCWMVDLVLGKS